MNFKIGQKVVCVKDFFPGKRTESTPVKGKIYTVREILDDGRYFKISYSC